MKQVITLTEQDLYNIINESIYKTLYDKELINEFDLRKYRNHIAAAGLAATLGVANYADRVKDYQANLVDDNQIETVDKNSNNNNNYYMMTRYQPSNFILNHIKQSEGFKSTWYDDGKGNYTIGYGFKMTPELKRKFPKHMTRKQADVYFSKVVIPELVRQFNNGAVPNMYLYQQGQLDGFFDLFYNVGFKKFTEGSPVLQQALREGDIDTIIAEMDHDENNKSLPGAKIRRDFERNLVRNN